MRERSGRCSAGRGRIPPRRSPAGGAQGASQGRQEGAHPPPPLPRGPDPAGGRTVPTGVKGVFQGKASEAGRLGR